MKILAIETSCDDTAIAVLEIKGNKQSPVFDALSNIVSSQIEIHKKYGGVYPIMAKREHQKNLVPVLLEALKQVKLLKNSKQIQGSKYKTLKDILAREDMLYKNLRGFLQKYNKPDIDLIAVTNGPGLEPCLWVGINFAKALSYYWDIPVLAVNHIESHILVNYFNNKDINFPAIALVASGGHTQLILMKGVGKYKILGETRDDAAGECFDKCAKILGLEYPGGPIIAELAEEVRPPRGGLTSIKLPRPMINTKDYDFSFSGLKTAVLYQVRKDGKKAKSKKYKEEMSAEIQQAVIDVLIKKTVKAGKDYKAKTIILGGGVSANQELRKQLKDRIEKQIPNTRYLIPNAALSTDNALMTAIAGYFHKKKTKEWKNIKASANLRIN
jgi:N6-L-threonylcarbamoyladenine synthase